MAILFDKSSRVVSQGITGKTGSFHTREAIKFGTKVVAGVTAGKGGIFFDGIPVYDRVIDAVERHGANAAGIYVPAASAIDAIIEQLEAGISLIVCVTEGIPVHDMVKVKQALRGSPSRMIGPNCPGIATPGDGKIGFMPNFIHKEGPVGVVSKSGTLTYEVVWQLTQMGIGQSTSVGIGGDPIVGSDFVDILTLFDEDPQTKLIVLIGEIGGNAEHEAADFIKESIKKPVVAFVAGRTSPPGRRMGHAGAIIGGARETAQEKEKALKRAGVTIAENPVEIGTMVRDILAEVNTRL
jgi:succinyl-CoA synthetase alpha subunit